MLIFQIHPQNETPDVGTYGISVPVGRKAYIEVSRHDFKLMRKPWGQCDPFRENLKYFSLYTLNNCLQGNVYVLGTSLKDGVSVTTSLLLHNIAETLNCIVCNCAS